MWIYGLLSLTLPIIAGVLLYRLLRVRRVRYVETPSTRQEGNIQRHTEIATRGGDLRRPVRNIMIAVAVVLLLWTFMGSHLVLLLRPSDSDQPLASTSDSTHRIARPDGTSLHVEVYGPADGPTLILTHGWSLDHRAWNDAKRDLSDRFKLIVWDLPGLGQSTQPNNRDYSLDKMAGDLGAVLQSTGKPAVLVGHSIGGMINLTYCRQHPEQLGREIAGLVQIDTSYTNPVKTTKSRSFDESLQKPVYEPLLHATVALSPLVRAMSWLSYQNGFAHLMAASSSFAGAETREQLDYAARRNYEASPAVIARGMLGMLRWDATPVLPNVRVATLILEGEQDTTTVPAASQYMRDAMPAAQLQMVNRAAHLGVLEQHRRYNDAIRKFAEDCFRRGRAALR